MLAFDEIFQSGLKGLIIKSSCTKADPNNQTISVIYVFLPQRIKVKNWVYMDLQYSIPRGQ